jgi:hypothetical protein
LCGIMRLVEVQRLSLLPCPRDVLLSLEFDALITTIDVLQHICYPGNTFPVATYGHHVAYHSHVLSRGVRHDLTALQKGLYSIVCEPAMPCSP